MADDRTAFFISPIGKPGSRERTRSDDLLEHVIEPVLNELSCSVVRADQMPNPGRITTDIVQAITASDVVVVDISGKNPNVFYELGIADAFVRPIVTLHEPEDTIPFDITDRRSLEIATTEAGHILAGDVGPASFEFRARVGAALDTNYEPESIVTQAQQRAAFTSTVASVPDGPVQAALSDLSVEISELRREAYGSRQLQRLSLNWEDVAELREFVALTLRKDHVERFGEAFGDTPALSQWEALISGSPPPSPREAAALLRAVAAALEGFMSKQELAALADYATVLNQQRRRA